ncbi:alcohol acetyltransferase-domain-containing protein [Mycena leptocephala]|nr:alcohol acetyltransferase-domain-containing protein [Mycena leptocephala]
MATVTRLRRLGLMERFHVSRHFLGLDSCVIGCAQYTTQDGLALTKEILFPALHTLIETHAALGLRLEGNEATADVFFVRLSDVDLSRVVEFSGKQDLQDALEGQLARNFETQTSLPLWRVEVLADNTVIFAVHHAIADGMSSLAFHLNLFQALQKAQGGDTSSSARVPTTTVLLPPLDRATSVWPSLRTFCSSVYTLIAPVVWTKAHSAWTGPAAPSTPNLKTHVRILTFPTSDVAAFCAAARTHGATLTSTVYVLVVATISQLIANEPARYTRIGAAVAISLRGVAGVPDDVICDYPSIFRALPRTALDLSWPEAKRFAGVLRGQKRKGREMVGMLRFLFGQFVPYHKSLLGAKRHEGFVVSNLGRVQPPAVEGKWTMGRTVFAQCDVVTGAAFNINVTGDPSGALNITLTWGEAGVASSFIEAFIARFREGFQAVVAQKI